MCLIFSKVEIQLNYRFLLKRFFGVEPVELFYVQVQKLIQVQYRQLTSSRTRIRKLYGIDGIVLIWGDQIEHLC